MCTRAFQNGDVFIVKDTDKRIHTLFIIAVTHLKVS